MLNVNYIGESGPTELMTNLVQVLSATHDRDRMPLNGGRKRCIIHDQSCQPRCAGSLVVYQSRDVCQN